jgi:predicted RNA binding protein YcfA (HicA-like mRNA interferase family)
VIETNKRKIVSRLKADGWIMIEGGKHDKFENPDLPGSLMVIPRHKEITPGVARSIAKQAGWIK